VIVGTTAGGSNVFNGIVNGTNLTLTWAFGSVVYAQVSVINNAGIEGPFSQSSPGTILLNPASILLGVATGQGVLKLSWPPYLSNSATLYSASNLTPGNWLPVPGNPVLTNRQGMLTIPVALDAARFYRLQLN